MFAVIKTGGKQYLVKPGDKIEVEKIDPEGKPSVSYGAGKKEGSEVIFDEVLLLQKGNKLEIGTPFVKDARVKAKILKQKKGKKIIIFKHKPKKHYKVKKGHRQSLTQIEITNILTG